MKIEFITFTMPTIMY